MSGRAIPHFRAQALGLAAVVVSAGIIMSCDSKDGVMDPGAVPGPTYEIFDGSGLGSVGFEDVNPHFFFLPPLVDNPSTTGVFDPAVAVGVQIFECELGDGVLVGNRRICYGDLPRPVVAEFDMTGGTGGERVDMTGEHYQVNWHTDESPVSTDVTKFYRIVVSYEKGGDLYPLGHVDVQFGRTGKDVKNINRSGDDFIGLKDGRTLPLKFRIEEFAATFAEQSSCLSDPELVDCDVETVEPGGSVEQQVAVWAEDNGRMEPAGVVTFTPGSVPPDGITVVLKYWRPETWDFYPSPEIPDAYEIPPFLTVELFNEDGTEYTGPDLGGDGARLAWCHDIDDESVDISNYAIYMVDEEGGGGRETQVLETGPGEDCELLEHAYAPQPDQDGSFLSRLKDGLSRVASSLTPQPLKAMHGGLNTEGPIRRFSDFGAVDLAADASVGPGAVGEPTTVTVRLLQGDGGPVGGDGSELYVGPTDEPDDNLFVVEVTGGPNVGAEVTAPVFDPADGTYSASYTPTLMGEDPDEILVTVFTRIPQYVLLESQVYGHESCIVEGILDCDVAELDDDATVDQQLVVWVQDSEGEHHPAGAVSFSPGSLPVPGITAVLKYIDPGAPNYPPSPEIPRRL